MNKLRTKKITEKILTTIGTVYLHVDIVNGEIVRVGVDSKHTTSDMRGLLEGFAIAMNLGLDAGVDLDRFKEHIPDRHELYQEVFYRVDMIEEELSEGMSVYSLGMDQFRSMKPITEAA